MAFVLPSWGAILEPSAPWALLLPCGSAGLWLLRSTAESVDGLEARIVRGDACASSNDLFDEWATALDFPPDYRSDWEGFEASMRDLDWLPGRAHAVLVTSADALLAAEPARWRTLVETLYAAQLARARRGGVLRFLFQAPAAAADRLVVLREFGVRQWSGNETA